MRKPRAFLGNSSKPGRYPNMKNNPKGHKTGRSTDRKPYGMERLAGETGDTQRAGVAFPGLPMQPPPLPLSLSQKKGKRKKQKQRICAGYRFPWEEV